MAVLEFLIGLLLVGWVLNDVSPSELKSNYYYRYGYYARAYGERATAGDGE